MRTKAEKKLRKMNKPFWYGIGLIILYMLFYDMDFWSTFAVFSALIGMILVVVGMVKYASDVSENINKKGSSKGKYWGMFISLSGIVCFVYSLISARTMLKDELLLPVLGIMFLYGLIAPFVGLGIINDGERAERECLMRQNKDPEWRKKNPQLAARAATYEKEELDKKAEYERKKKGQAVIIQEAFLGHFDSPGSAWFLGGFPDYAGGWDIKCAVTNVGVETIKYVHVVFAAYNAVGDICHTSFGHDAITKCIFTGPISPGCSSGPRGFMHIWYDIVPKSLKVESIHVEFMNGTSQDVDKYGKVTNHGF